MKKAHKKRPLVRPLIVLQDCRIWGELLYKSMNCFDSTSIIRKFCNDTGFFNFTTAPSLKLFNEYPLNLILLVAYLI